MVATLGGDGLDGMVRAESSQTQSSSFSSIHIGQVTAVSNSTLTGFVRIPALNDEAQLGPYKFLQPFTNAVQSSVQQTLSTTSATVSGTSVITGVSLSATTTSIPGVYGNLNLPVVGDRVLVVFMGDTLDQGVIVGKL